MEYGHTHTGSVKEVLKSVGGLILILVIGGVAVVLMTMLVKGAVWASDVFYPWMVLISVATLVSVVLILLPMAIFKASRPWAGVGLVLASYVFGATVWMWCAMTVDLLWGIPAMIIGMMMAGVGVIPMAIIALAFHGSWALTGETIACCAVVFAIRIAGTVMAQD